MLFSDSGRLQKPWHFKYLAMYSSVYGGIVTDPTLMMIPADDHVVHRGDGVFDVAKCVEGGVYQFDGHLDRLFRSAAAISLVPPCDREAIERIAIETIRAGNEPNCSIRITLSRGPGGFSVSPLECPESALYVNVFRTKTLPPEYLTEGVRISLSEVPIKPSYFARVKSCNYLPNVLMALEAKTADAHFTVALDEQGFLAEGSTENIIVVSGEGYLLFPEYNRILKGLTVSRAAKLAEKLVEEGLISGVRFANISPEEAYRGREMMLLGTSIDVLPAVYLNGRTIGEGKPGPVAKRLRQLFRDDMTRNPEMITRVFA